MIRCESNLNHFMNVGWKPPALDKRWNKNQIYNSNRQWPLLTNTIKENWSKLAVLPSIKASRDESLIKSQITVDQGNTGWNTTSDVTSYSQIRENWLKVKNSKYISHSIKDKIHEIYLDETTDHLNQLVFGEPDTNVVSVCSGTEVKRVSSGKVDSNQEPSLVPRPPTHPRGKNTRRYHRTANKRVDKTELTALNPVTESPRQD